MKALIIRIVKQMKNDKRSLALLLVAPIMIMSLMYLLLGDTSYMPKIAVDTNINQTFLESLKSQDIIFIETEKNTDIEKLLIDKKIDALIKMDKSGISIRMLEADGSKVTKVTDAIKNALSDINPSAVMEMSFIYGNASDNVFDNLVFVLLGVISFFFVFLLSGVSFIRERTTGTLERLMLTPIKRYQVVLGYTLGFGVFAAIQGVLVTLFCTYVLKMQVVGSLWLCILIMILLAFAAVATGTLVSIFANNEFQVVQFIPIVIIPQIFFSGLIPIETLPFNLGKLSYVMPIYYGCTALREVILKGFGFVDIWIYCLALLGFIVIVSIVNTFALKKYRGI